jgi:hypothetical protein
MVTYARISLMLLRARSIGCERNPINISCYREVHCIIFLKSGAIRGFLKTVVILVIFRITIGTSFLKYISAANDWMPFQSRSLNGACELVAK